MSVKETQKIKGLETQKNKLIGDRDALKLEKSNLQKELSTKNKSINQIEAKIAKTKKGNGNLRISEHAMVRYFERVKGFDIKEIENSILSDELKKMVDTLGPNGKYPIGDHQVVLKDGVIVSII